ncbi:uncharacterized protein LOC120285970 isoform X2 [Eucalyptus grandis]|uniref:Uncharacterized protein n=2 Tax=Eucalyptus grandis TaxID=71139 RepID=A0ACC3LBR9_EUCGR|nr:uncharacterized protein LOC120285970 isoform X2 [Eucalyptus grandis]KAK3436345.1 hypothetical protein EUGRSUZ_C00945 [Eucalyptus grandis]
MGDLSTLTVLFVCDFWGRSESKKRGLSSEEKREKMLQIFYESRDFFLRMQYQLPMRQPIDGQVGISDDLDYLEMSTPGN